MTTESSGETASGGGPRPLVAFAFFVACALAFTWPLMLHCRTHFWGVRYDLWSNLWLMWYFLKSLVSGHLSLNTPLLFYPSGFSLWAYGHFALQILFAPLLLVASPPVAYAIVVWGVLAASALALYALAFQQTGSRWAALIAGTLYGFHSLKFAELAVGSVEQAATFGLPLYAWCMFRWDRAGGAWWGAATFAVLMLTAVCNWFFGIALTVFTVAYAGFHVVCGRERPAIRWILVRRMLLLGTLCLIAVSPFLSRVQPEILTRPTLTRDTIATWPAESGDQPAVISAMKQDQVEREAQRQTIMDSVALNRLAHEEPVTIPRDAGVGVQLLFLGVLGCLLGGGRARFWGVCFVLFTLISMGPFLRPHDLEPPSDRILYPFYLLYNLFPPLRVGYRPYRYLSVALMAGAVLSAFAVAAILRRTTARARAPLALLMLATVIFVRWGILGNTTTRAYPHLSDARIPQFYHALASEPGDFALVEIPYHHWMFGDSNARFQYYQTLHQRPIMNNSQFINPAQLLKLRDLQQAHPLVAVLDEQIHARRLPTTPSMEKDADWLRESGFRYIVVHTSFPADRFHLTGWQEDRETIGEAYLDLLERLFGAPRNVGEALLFDVRKAGEARPARTSVMLDSPSDFRRSRMAVELSGLSWPIPPTTWSRLAAWLLPEGTTRVVVLELELQRNGVRRVVRDSVKLEPDAWQRVVWTAERLGVRSDEKLVGVRLGGSKADDRAAVSRVQLLVDSQGE